MEIEHAYHYYAFISYNHRDEKVAKWLQARLEHYKLPAVARKEIGEDVKIRPVFRYVSDLGVAVLREKIKQELEASKYLIVICSPHSAKPNVKGEHWVNDEVKRFSEMGRKDRIIPVIVDGVPGDIERECFCPALAAAEIAGVDFQKEKKLICLQKIVAKLLGLRPDILIQRYLEEQKKRRKRLFLGILPALVLVGLVGLFAWDMTRPVSLYFADYVDCYGLPEGIYEVPKSDLRMRSSTYRFDYQGYYWHGVHVASLPRGLFGVKRKLHRVVHVGPTDIPTNEYNEFRKHRPDIMEFVYDGANRLEKKVLRKRGGLDFVSGPITKKMHYANRKNAETGATIVNGHMWETFDDENKFYFLQGNITQRKDSSSEARTRITHSDIKRDSDGHMTSIRFLSAPDMIPACDKDGVYGVAYELTSGIGQGATGRIKEQHFLDEKGDRKPDRYGVAVIKFEYAGPYISSIEYNDKARGLVLGRAGFYRSFLQYDGYGNCTNEVLKNKYDKPVYRVLRDEDMGKELNGAQIWASCSYVFSNGLMVARYAYQPDGELLQRKGLIATIRWGYNELGDGNFIEYLDAKGKRTISADGFAIIRAESDRYSGKTTSLRFFMEDGVTPAYNRDGVSGFDSVYDEKSGLIIEQRYYDGNGLLVPCKEGNSICRFNFDNSGRVIQETYYDACTNICVPATLGGNVGSVKSEYPANNGGVEKRLYFTDANCCTRAKSSKGVSGVFTRYDEYGRMVECWDVDEKDLLFHRRHDSSMRKMDYSRVFRREEIVPGYYAEVDWRITRTTWYSDLNNPFYTNDGFCSKREIADLYGNIVFEIWENDKGERVDKKNGGYSVVVNTWSASGELVSQYYYDKSGQAVYDKISDTAGCEMSYDNQTHELRSTRYLSIDHRTSRCFKGTKYSEIRYEPTHDGIKETSYWHNDKPVRCSQNYHMVRRLQDVHGNPLDEWYFNEERAPVECVMDNGFSYHHGHAEYDAFRQPTMVCRYDEKEVLCQMGGDNFCIREMRYDSQHRKTEELLIGKPGGNTTGRPSYDDYPGSDRDGVSRILTSYHDTTQTKARIDEYGMKDSPCLYGCTGVWHKVTMYDVNGNETNCCTYAVDGSLIRDSNNVHTRTVAYFDDAHRHKRRDLYGKDIWGYAGIVHAVTWYDSTDNVIEQEYFGGDERHASDKNGLVKFVREYFPNAKTYGRCDEFGLKDASCLYGDTGVWHRVTLYDLVGRITNQCYFTASDLPIADKNGITHYTISYSNDVECAERCNLYGNCIWGTTGLCHVVRIYDSKDRLVEQRRYGKDDVPAPDSDGEFITKNSYHDDTRTKSREEWVAAPGSKLTHDGMGAYRHVKIYGPSGNESSEQYYSEDKKVLARWSIEIGMDGRERKTAYVHRDGLSAMGFQCLKDVVGANVSTDDQGRLVGLEFFDAMGKAVPGIDGAVRGRQSYHGTTEICAVKELFGDKIMPCLEGVTGVWHKVTMYDVKGNETNCCTYAADGSPIRDSNNVHARTFTYFDDPVRHKRRDLYGMDMCGNTGIVHSVTWYDNNDNVVEECYFGEGERPVADKDGTVKFIRVGDKTVPCLGGATGVWHKVTIYDVKGNETNCCTYAVAGSPIRDSNNVYARTFTYFDDPVRHKRRDLYGMDMWGNTGIVHSVAWYDNNDNVVEECYFGEGERPVADKDGTVKFIRAGGMLACTAMWVYGIE